MLHHIKKLFGIKPKEAPVAETPVAEVPYKVETPSVVSEQARQAVVESIAPAKKTAVKKPAAKKAPAAKKPKALKVAK